MKTYDEVFTFNDLIDIKALKARCIDGPEKFLLDNFIVQNPDTIVIAGGCFSSWINNESPRDIDIFILDCNNSNRKLMMDLNSRGKYNPSWRSTPMKAYSQAKLAWSQSSIKINSIVNFSNFQFIFTEAKTRKELMDSFDLVHAKINYCNGVLYVSKESLEACKNKKLISTKGDVWTHVRSDRLTKFLANGWTIGDYIYDKI